MKFSGSWSCDKRTATGLFVLAQWTELLLMQINRNQGVPKSAWQPRDARLGVMLYSYKQLRRFLFPVRLEQPPLGKHGRAHILG